MMKGVSTWTLILLLLLLLPLESVSETKRGGTITVAIRNDLVLMNPLVATGSTEQTIRELMFEPLLGLDLKGNLQPYLAESWQVSNDGRLYTLRLRRGVRFHNGVGMTAEDVKFSIDYTMNPKNGARGITALGIVERVETANEYP